MIRTLLTIVFLAAAFSSAANATANQVTCSTSFPMTIAYGDDVSNCKLSTVGQIALLQFQGNAGDKVTIVVNASWSNGPCIGLYDPTNTKLSDACGVNYPYNDYNISADFTLAMSGQYSIRVHDANYTSTGTFGLMLDCWYPAVVVSPLTVGTSSNGSTVNGETIDEWTFPGNSGEDLTLQVNSSYSNGPCYILLEPGGAAVGSACGVNYPYNDYQARGEYTLPATGAYVVRVYSYGFSESGTYSLLAQCLASCAPPPPPPANCAYSLAPASQVFPAAAGTGTVGVLTTAGCPWTASTASSFLSITSGSSGTGPGVVQFSATANSAAAARAGTLTIAGQTATINQAGTAPLLLLSPISIAVQWRQQGPLPATIPLSVFTAATSLSFTAAASSTGNWLTVSPASGTAPATIVVTVNPSSLQPGTYQGTVTVTAPTASPSSQTFTVSLTVVAAGSPALSVTTTNLSYSFAQGSQQARQERVLIGNSGGGTLSYNSSASSNSGGNWLTVTQDAAGATPSTPDPLTVSVDPSTLGPGTYTGQITIATSAATATIPVTVTVSAVQQTILLSQTGLTFTAVANGGIVPPQTFGILNSGNGVMDWSVSSTTVTGGSNWLSITPTSGSTDASSLTVPLVTVSVNPTNLAPGQYSGQIKVTAAAADDTPQFVSVILNVLPAGSNPGPLVLPTGLIFTQAVGGAPAASQTITLSNLTASQLTFATGELTNDGANWFSVTPATGTATPTQATTLTVSVSSTGLSPAIRQGVLTLLFQDGSVRTVNILYLLATGGVSSTTSSVVHPLTTSASCTPTKLLPLVTSLGSQFTVPAAWPNTLAVQVVDDCGNADVTGTVTGTFSNGDPPLPLISLKNGDWTGTWQVNNANDSVIAITVNADNPSLNISGAVSVSGGLQSSANAPVMTSGGVLNAASYALSAPLSPGAMISIFGSNLANGTSSVSTFPLPSQLSGTLVTIGGVAAPLLYAGSGQINAIIPYGLPVNTGTQVIVQQGNAYTTPQPIVLAAAAPAIFTKSGAGNGQGIIIDYVSGMYAAPGSPAQDGDAIVIYAEGLGATTPAAANGQPATTSPLLEVPGVSLTIGGQSARVDFAGVAPGYSGFYQINATVPNGVHGNALPVVLTVAGQSSPPVTMAVQ